MRLVAVLALGEHQSAEECAERHRDTEQRADPGRADAGDQHRQRKRFAAAALRHQPEQHRQHEPADDGNGANRQRRFQHHHRDGAQCGLARENRYEQQQPDDREVLIQQHADHQPAVRRIELVAGRQFAQHDGGARQRDEQADEQPDAPRFAHRQDQHRHQHRGGAGDLQRSAEQHGLPDAANLAERELEADGKEQQHDAEIGEDVDVLLRFDDADAGRAGNRAGDDERDDRRDAQPRQDEDQAQRDRVRQNQFGEECSVLRHAPVVYSAVAARARPTAWLGLGDDLPTITSA